MKPKILILISAIIILALVSKLIFLDLRPLHHDEGVNYFFVKKIITGQGFSYDPTNYHGPFYFFLLALSFIILGVSEFSLRFPAALAGIFLIATVLFLNFKDKINNYKLAILLILSPSLLYYSRYSIHESWFILFSFFSLYFLNKVIEEKTLEKLPFLAVFLGFAFITKETAIILLFAFFIIILFNIKEIKKISFKKEKDILIISAVIFILIWIIFFTSFLTNLQGLSDSIKTFQPWTSTGIEGKGHEKPIYYFLKLIIKYEFPFFILSIAGVYLYFKKEIKENNKREKIEKNLFIKNSIIWFLVFLIIYSLIPYKTPWLVINITLPMILLSAYALEKIKFKKIIFIISIIYLLLTSIYLNFIIPWQSQNELAYVHTDKNILNLVNEINLNAAPDSKILILAKDYWPLPFYLDKYKVFYLEADFDEKYLKEYELVIVQERFIGEMKTTNLGPYTLRSGVKVRLVG